MPSGRAKVVSLPVTPAPAASVSLAVTVNGGQFWAHVSVQVLVLAESGLKVYSVLPSSPVR